MLPSQALGEPRSMPPHLPAGLRLGDLQLRSVLGTGGSAITYLAYDFRRQCYVALKEYFPRRWAVREADLMVRASTAGFASLFSGGLDRFIAEAEILARLQLPGIVRVERVFASMGTGYIQLSYVEGPTLAEWLARSNPRPTQFEMDGFAVALTRSLQFIHGVGILHCDIGPRNIILSSMGLPVLIDFGSARLALAQQGHDPTILVTPHYSPQEVYNSSGAQRGPWTDIYAAAAVLHTLLLGAPPPNAPDRALGAGKVTLSALPRLQIYRHGFLSAVDWALEFMPSRRPQTVQSWAATLLPASNGSASGLRM